MREPFIRVDGEGDMPASRSSIDDAVAQACASSQDFVAVHRNEDVFLQVALGRDQETLFLHADADSNQRVTAAPGLPAERATELLASFLAGTDAWETELDWAAPPEIKEPRRWWRRDR